MTISGEQFDAFRKLLDSGRRFVLTTHISPDGDGLGSEVALAHYLDGLGKEVSVLNHSPTPDYYFFLDDGNFIRQFDPGRDAAIVQEADVIIVVDTNHPDRTAGLKDHILKSPAKKVVIDHHLEPDPFGDVFIIDESAAATGEIVFALLQQLQGVTVSPAIATALYTAILTDTGSFRFPKTDGDVHRVVATLIDCGADPVEIYHRIYEQAPINRLRLLGKVLAGMEAFHGGSVIVMTVPGTFFKETGTSENDVERFAPYALEIKGVQIALMFTELTNQIKVSFRSRGDIWINKLAQEFGGNGHKNAAGARIDGGVLADVRQSVIEHSLRYLQS